MCMMLRKGCSIVIAVAVLLICTLGSAFAYNVSGVIYGGSNPLSGATLALKNAATLNDVASASTDQAGAYSFTGVADGSYTLSITPPAGKQFDVATTALAVQGADAEVNFALVPKPVDVTGIVTTPDGTPAPNVYVMLSHQRFGITGGGQALTGTDGSYTIHLEQADSYKVAVATYNTGTAQLPRFFIPSLIPSVDLTSAVTHQDIVLPIMTVTGKTADANGDPIAGVNVSFWFQDAITYAYSYGTTSSDASGNYSIPVFAHSDYVASVTPPADSGVVQLWAGGLNIASDTVQNFTLSPAVPLSGTVATAGGAGISNLQVTASNQATGTDVGSAVTDAEGHYSIPVGPGTYLLTVTRAVSTANSQYLPSNVPLPRWFYLRGIVQNIAVAGATTQDVTLPVVTLAGRTVDGGGNPVPNVTVTSGYYDLMADGKRYWVDSMTTTSDDAGSFSFLLIAATGYSLTLTPPAGLLLAQTVVNDLDVSGDTSRDFVLDPAYALSGKVTRPGGTPLGGAMVEAVQYSTPTQGGVTSRGFVTTDADGNFTFTVPAGSYAFNLYSNNSAVPGFVGYTVLKDVTVAGATTANIEVPLVTLSGAITDSKGAAVVNAKVTPGLRGQQLPTGGLYYVYSIPVASDSTGHYSLSLIAGPGYTVTFDSPDGSHFEELVKDQLDMPQDRVLDVVLPEQPLLTIVKSGSGTGTVWSTDPTELYCGSTCSQYYNSGTPVTINAYTNDDRSIFAGWDGCDNPSGSVCRTTMNAAKTVTAIFNIPAPYFSVGYTSEYVYAGSGFSFTPICYGGDSFSISNKPSWASFDTSTGTVSGTPGDADVGTYSFVISASNPGGNTSQPAFRVTVLALSKPNIAVTPPGSVTAWSFYRFNPGATNAQWFSISNRPRWANFDQSTGVLSGYPTNSDAGTYSNIVITASNRKGSFSLPFSITVAPLYKPAISGIPSLRATTDRYYSFSPTTLRATSFSIANKPAWATFNPYNGALYGTPGSESLGTYSNIQISASNPAGTTALPAFSITVALPPPTISGTPVTKVTAGKSYSFTPTAANVASFSILNRPSWASFDQKTGALTGTPTTVGVNNYITISASNSTATTKLPTFSISVVPPAPTISGTPATTVTSGQAYSFTPTASGATTFSIVNKPLWAFFNAATGALTGTPPYAAVGSYSKIVIRASNSGGSTDLAAFAIAVVPPLPTIKGTPATAVTTGRVYSFVPSATSATSFNIENKPSWANFNTLTGALTGTPPAAAAGTYAGIVINANNSTGAASLPAFTITVALPMPTISGSPATVVTAGRGYSFIPTKTGATSFSISNKPPWASFDTATGALTGTPANPDAGSYSGIVISAANSTGTVSLPAFTIRVALPLPTISGTAPVKATVGTAYSFTPVAANATSFTIVNKPVWASFDSHTGTLSGTPGSANVATYSYISIRAVNSTGSAALPTFSISVTPPPPNISGTPATSAPAGAFYSFTPVASNATSFSIVNKPSWATFSTSTGALTGTPASTGAFNNIVISASNGRTSASLPAFSIAVTTGGAVAF